MEGKTCRKYKLIWNFLQVHFRVQVVVDVIIVVFNVNTLWCLMRSTAEYGVEFALG